MLVMAPTRPLIAQHRDTFLRLLRIKEEDVVVLTGKIPQPQRFREWEAPRRVYFATPETVRNDVEAGLKIGRFSLLVFDEAHRAVRNYAYTKVAEAYLASSDYPVILALTASPGAERKRIREVCRALRIERIEARTEEDPDVRPYVKPISVNVHRVRLPPSYGRAIEVMRDMLRRRLEDLARRVGEKCHVSTRSALGEVVPYIRAIFKENRRLGASIARWLELEEDTIRWLMEG